MAINIFSGSDKSKRSAGSPVASTAAQRAAASTAAVGVPASASSSGNTAVQSGGIMSKVGSFLNKVSGLASLVPGPVGTIGSIVNGLTSTNDPEWWQSVKGDGLSTNIPLQTVTMGTVEVITGHPIPITQVRPSFLELQSRLQDPQCGNIAVPMIVDQRMTTQYLLPQVRKVVNAITLQDAPSYSAALEVNCAVYALWRQLQKYDYLLKHGQTFLPTMADGAFPLFSTANAAFLQSLTTRLEEYLRTNVRLPHTLCEYLTWRYGRIFRMNASAKAGFVLYNIVDMMESVAQVDMYASGLMSYVSSNAATQKANADLYNAYLAHDQEVLLADESQAAYDSKEFCLRTNLDLIGTTDPSFYDDVTESVIMMDSNLDNPTVFMASTVSSYVDDGTGTHHALFPVDKAIIYTYDTTLNSAHATSTNGYLINSGDAGKARSAMMLAIGGPTNHWFYMPIVPLIPVDGDTKGVQILAVSTLCKAADFYNVGLFMPVGTNDAYATNPADYAGLVDVTAITIDGGSVSDTVLRNEQVFAFANLVNEDATAKTTYKQVEKRVATDVANFVENTDVATLAPSGK